MTKRFIKSISCIKRVLSQTKLKIEVIDSITLVVINITSTFTILTFLVLHLSLIVHCNYPLSYRLSLSLREAFSGRGNCAGDENRRDIRATTRWYAGGIEMAE